MSNTTAPDSAVPDDRAIIEYEIVTTQASRLERGIRWVRTIVIGLLFQDVYRSGGARVQVRNRATGEIAATFTQGSGDAYDVAADLQERLTTMSVGDFQRDWLQTT